MNSKVRAEFEYWASDDGEYPAAVERSGHGYKLAQIQTYWQAWSAAAEKYEPSTQQQEAKPVAVIGDAFSILWIERGPIAPIIERNGLKVGDKLYARPPRPAEADVRCEGCGYMTYHREHMGCVRAAQQQKAEPVGVVPQDVEEFIASESCYDPEHPKSSEHDYILVDDLRDWMAGHVRVPVELLEQTLADVRDRLQEANNEAFMVCCGRSGSECCGSPEPEWPEHAMKIMDTLGPVERNLSAMLNASKGEGK